MNTSHSTQEQKAKQKKQSTPRVKKLVEEAAKRFNEQRNRRS